MTPEHFIFIPGVLALGIALGYAMGARAVREEIQRKRDAQRR